MVTTIACQCEDRPPHTHVPEKWTVRLDDGIELDLDEAHVLLNQRRISKVLGHIPARIEWWGDDAVLLDLFKRMLTSRTPDLYAYLHSGGGALRIDGDVAISAVERAALAALLVEGGEWCHTCANVGSVPTTGQGRDGFEPCPDCTEPAHERIEAGRGGGYPPIPAVGDEEHSHWCKCQRVCGGDQ